LTGDTEFANMFVNKYTTQQNNGAASPKFWEGPTTLLLASNSIYKTTRYARNLGWRGPVGPPGYAYGTKSIFWVPNISLVVFG